MGHCAAVVLLVVNKQRCCEEEFALDKQRRAAYLFFPQLLPDSLQCFWPCLCHGSMAGDVGQAFHPTLLSRNISTTGWMSFMFARGLTLVTLVILWLFSLAPPALWDLRFLVQCLNKAFMVPRGWTLVWSVGWYIFFFILSEMSQQIPCVEPFTDPIGCLTYHPVTSTFTCA